MPIFNLKNQDNLQYFPFDQMKLMELLEKAHREISIHIGPFVDTPITVNIKKSGISGAEIGYFGISPFCLSVDSLSNQAAIQRMYSLIIHEMTHVLTYQWGEGFLPLFFEGIAYLMSSKCESLKTKQIDQIISKMYFDVKENTIRSLLNPQKYFIAKESMYLLVPKISSSICSFIIDTYGINQFRTIFESGKSFQMEKNPYEEAAKYRKKCFMNLLQKLNYKNINEFENGYIDYLNRNVEGIIYSDYKDEYYKSLSTIWDYQYWHCHQCWRPNKNSSEVCSHCNSIKEDKNEFEKEST